MTNRLSILIGLVLLMSNSIFSQKEVVQDSLSFYGKLRFHISTFNEKVTLQENSPRVGVKFGRKINKFFSAFGTLEYGLKLTRGGEFNTDANTTSEFVVNPFVPTEIINFRLGSIGFRHAKLGSISIGKQWGIYYDVASFTDKFIVFGGESNGVYSGGTDGGWKGTGRADVAIQYKLDIKGFGLGLQAQLFSDRTNYGTLLKYKFNNGLTLAGAFNSASIDQKFIDLIDNLSSNSNNLIFGIKYENNNWKIGFNSSFNDDEFKVADTSAILAFSTRGQELFVRHLFFNKLELMAGFNFAFSIGSNNLSSDYRLLHYSAGARCFFAKDTYLYGSMRVSDSRFVSSIQKPNVFVLGFGYRFDFQRKRFVTPKE